jgi:branched-subunit amino acid transport protein
MDATLKLWAVIIAVGLLNYLSRLSFIAIFAQRVLPPLLARALRFVPAAMLTALIVPMIVAGSATIAATWTDPKVLAAALAGIAAFLTRSTLKTLGVGMAALWVLQAVVPRIG